MFKNFRFILLTAILTSGFSTAQAAEDYGQAVVHKLGVGVSNFSLGWLELPKNVLNTTNESNIALGITGGLIKGCLHLIGRSMAGVADFVTAPLPTKPLIQPEYPWENFSAETKYGALGKPNL